MSFFSRFSSSNPESAERRFYKDQAETVERVFREDIKTLRELFPLGAYSLKDQDYSDPKDIYLDKIGLNAISHTEEIGVEQFPLLVNILKEGREEVSYRRFERKSEGSTKTTILATEDRFSGKTVRLLTNDIDLLKSISATHFSPPPPWIAWYELGPTGLLARQGDAEFWFDHVWDRFWNNLNPEEKKSYLSDWRMKTKSYISDEEWNEWISFIEVREPGYWERNKEESRGERND